MLNTRSTVLRRDFDAVAQAQTCDADALSAPLGQNLDAVTLAAQSDVLARLEALCVAGRDAVAKTSFAVEDALGFSGAGRTRVGLGCAA